MEKIRVLLADDDAVQLEELRSWLNGQEDTTVVGCVRDGLALMDELRKQDVDVVVLDLVMPRLDGFGVLEQLRCTDLPHKPRLVALTALMRDDFVQRAVHLGVDYYLMKPYDAAAVHRVLVQLTNDRSAAAEEIAASRHIVSAVSLDERIANIFLSMGIPAHIKGYHFLREAIKLVVEDHDKINAITKDLYPTVAKHFGTSSSKVERAIRHAIDVAWNRGQMENINMLFGSRLYIKHDKPTNGEFIAMIADRLAIERSA